MFRAIGNSFSGLARRPLLFLPAALFAIIDYFLLAGQRYGLVAGMVEAILNKETLLNYVFRTLYANPAAFWTMILAFAITLFLEVWVLFGYSRAAYDLDKNVSSGLALKEAFGMFFEALKYFVFTLFAAIFFLLGLAFSAWVYFYVSYAGIILALISFVLGVAALVGFFFTVPAMATRQLELKRALKDSWAFAKRYFWEIVFLLAILAVINEVILGFAQGWLSSQYPGYGDVVSGVIQAVKLAYSGLAIGLFYVERQKRK
ncbi:MAG: hypothetical protein WC602_01110 [archaeon]